MIRKLQLTPEDQAFFEKWSLGVERTLYFNWTPEGLLESYRKEECWGLWNTEGLQSVVCFLKPPLEVREILWLATSKKAEGQGLMRSLLSFVLDNPSINAHSHDVSGFLEVLLEVHEKNLKAIKLYAGLGFKEVGRRKNYYRDGASALLMAYKKP